MEAETEHVPDVIELIAEWGLTNSAFRRNRLDVRRKVLAAVLAASGVSYREAAGLLGGMSHIAVRDSYVSLTGILPRGEKVHRRSVAIDESVVKVGRDQAWVWLARDVDRGQTLSFMASFTGSPEDSATFARSVLETCSNKPLLRPGRGPNRPRALKNLDFYFQTEGSSGVVQIFQKIFGGRSR